jgi:hypothetical protein
MARIRRWMERLLLVWFTLFTSFVWARPRSRTAEGRSGAAGLLAFAAAALPQAAAAKQPFTLTLQAPKQPLKAGQRLLLRVKVTNTSDRSTLVGQNKGLVGIRSVYRVHVRDQRGRPVPPRPPARGPRGKGVIIHSGSVYIRARNLKPGETFTDLVNVTDEYDLSQPGEYKIWVAELLGPRLSDGLVKSNVVTVTVVK